MTIYMCIKCVYIANMFIKYFKILLHIWLGNHLQSVFKKTVPQGESYLRVFLNTSFKNLLLPLVRIRKQRNMGNFCNLIHQFLSCHYPEIIPGISAKPNTSSSSPPVSIVSHKTCCTLCIILRRQQISFH